MTCRLAWKKYELALREPLRTAHGRWEKREGILLRLEDADGRVGFGEIAPVPGFAGETIADAEAACRALEGKTTWENLREGASAFPCVRFALAAARAGLPPAPAGRRLPVAALLPAGRRVLEMLPDRLEQGFLAFKWKVGVDRPDEEIGLLGDLCAALPTYARLRLDANGAWDRRQAARWLDRAGDFPVEFVEQPLDPGDQDGLLGLAEDFPVKLALDESVAGLEQARSWQGLGWNGVFVIKPAIAGPLSELADWLELTKPDVVFSSAIETALARAQILAFALGRADLTRAVGFGIGPVFGDPRWDGPLIGPLVDATWCHAVDPAQLWNELP